MILLAAYQCGTQRQPPTAAAPLLKKKTKRRLDVLKTAAAPIWLFERKDLSHTTTVFFISRWWGHLLFTSL
jgi:hypothetical protein